MDPAHPAYDEYAAQVRFCQVLRMHPDLFERALTMLSPEKADALRQKFKREDFEKTAEWIRAITREVFSNLLKRVVPFGEIPSVVQLEQSATFFSQEVFDRELAVDERVDQMIERAIKRLIYIKSVKPILLDHAGDRAAHPKDRQKLNGPVSRQRETLATKQP
jgi:hypothetical protein